MGSTAASATAAIRPPRSRARGCSRSHGHRPCIIRPSPAASAGAALAARALLLVALLHDGPAALSAARRARASITYDGLRAARAAPRPAAASPATPTRCSRARRRTATPATASAPQSAPPPSPPTTSSPPIRAAPATRRSPGVRRSTSITPKSRGSCSTCHNGVQAQGKPPDAHRHRPGVRRLPHDPHLGGRRVHPPGRHRQLRRAATTASRATGMPATHIPIGTTALRGLPLADQLHDLRGHERSITLAVTSLTCASCHETAAYLGMHPSTNTTAADSRPNATLDKNHPVTGDCGQCHDTTTFANSALRPANHIPTNAPCVQCHTTAGNYALYSVTGAHQGVTGCLTCHAPDGRARSPTSRSSSTPATTSRSAASTAAARAAIPRTTSMPAASSSARPASPPRRSALPATRTVAAAVAACQTCHESALLHGHAGEHASTTPATRAPPRSTSVHPTSGDCNGCHTTTPTFASQRDPARQAREPHPDHCPLHAVPHHRRQLRALLGHRHPPGRDRLPELPRPDGRPASPTSRSSHRRRTTSRSAASTATAPAATRRPT